MTGVSSSNRVHVLGTPRLTLRWLEDVDIGFAFLPAFRGKGYAREAAAATLDHARDQLGLRRVAAIVAPGNAASTRLLERLGLRFERMVTPPGEATAICLYSIDTEPGS